MILFLALAALQAPAAAPEKRRGAARRARRERRLPSASAGRSRRSKRPMPGSRSKAACRRASASASLMWRSSNGRRRRLSTRARRARPRPPPMRAAPISGCRPAMPGSPPETSSAHCGRSTPPCWSRTFRTSCAAKSHLDRARARVALERASAARGEVDRALQLVPSDAFAWYLSAALARRENNQARAATDIARAKRARAGQSRHPPARRHDRRPGGQYGGGRTALSPRRRARAPTAMPAARRARAWRRCAKSRCRRRRPLRRTRAR